MREAGNRSVEQLAKEENEMLLGLLILRGKGTTASVRPKKAAKPN
jgi:hypothetical protein